MISISVLSLSILFQFLVVFIAFRNVKLTGKIASWIIISSATILMVIRRIIPLYHLIMGRSCQINRFNEVIGLILSFLLFIGILGIRHIFLEWKIAQTKIATTLNEKKVLLKEVHHRIKNNMSVIRNLLSIQSDNIKIPEATAAFQDAIARIDSMGILYDKLYLTESYTNVSIKVYLSQLIDEIFQMFPDRRSIKVEKQIDDFTISTEIIFPLGIIVNELITNAMKYAFPNQDNGLIQISAVKKENNITLVFEDNGIGIPELLNHEKQKGFGLTLIELLTDQIGGNCKIERTNGLKYIIEFEIKENILK